MKVSQLQYVLCGCRPHTDKLTSTEFLCAEPFHILFIFNLIPTSYNRETLHQQLVHKLVNNVQTPAICLLM